MMLLISHRLILVLPHVTVLVPCNRVDEYFDSAINSTLDQDYPNFSVLIVGDNLSEVDVNHISNNYLGDPRVVLAKSPGLGLVTALNYGLQLVDSELVARMDCDDVMLPRRLSRQVEYLLRHPRVDALGMQVEFICAHGIPKGVSNYPKRISGFPLAKPFDSRIAHPTVMFRKSKIVEAGMYREQFRHAEDLDLWNRVLRTGKMRNLSTLGIQYRQHQNQVSTSRRTEQIESARNATLVDFAEMYLNLHFASDSGLFLKTSLEQIEELLKSPDVPLLGKIRMRAFFSSQRARELAREFGSAGGMKVLFIRSQDGKNLGKKLLSTFVLEGFIFNVVELIKHVIQPRVKHSPGSCLKCN